MLDISPQHLHQLREVLENCAPIDSDEQFRAVFTDSRISTWRNNLPQANNVATRSDLVIDFLRGRYDDSQQNALILLLYVLADGIPEGDSCKQRFLDLAQELEYINPPSLEKIQERKQLHPMSITPKRILLHPVFLPIVALLTLFAAMAVIPNVRNWFGLDPTETPTIVVNDVSAIEYVGTVIDAKSKRFIRDALITFKFEDKIPIREYTDSHGTYKFTTNFDGNKLDGRVEVRANDCEFYDEEVSLYKDTPNIQDIRLNCDSEMTIVSPIPPTQVWDFKDCTIPVASSFLYVYDKYRNYLGCAIDVAYTLPLIAEQDFQGGHLFWREDKNELYIVYDRLSGSKELFTGTWFKAPPEWQWDGSYHEGVGISPPSDDLYEPTRGFGWVWRTHLGGPDGKLGWALDEEHGFNNLAKIQVFERGFMFRASDSKVYCLLDTGEFFGER